MTEHHLADWTPREDVIISFADQTGAVRTQEELDQMFEEFREVANQHGFHPDGWGLDQSFRAFYTDPLRDECSAFLALWDTYWQSNALGGPTWDELSAAAEKLRMQTK